MPVIDDGTLETQYGLTGLSKDQQVQEMQKLVDAYNKKLSLMKDGQSLEEIDNLEEISDNTLNFRDTLIETGVVHLNNNRSSQ